MHSKGNHRQNKKTAYGVGESICKWYDQQGVNIQNIQTAHTTQYQKKKNGQKTWVDVFPKTKYRWLTGTWKDTQHH